MEGWTSEEVKVGMARLFKLDLLKEEDAGKLERLFSGRKVVIKAGLKRSVAKAYVDAIAKAGGKAHFEFKDVLPDGVSERRKTQRRKRGDRRRTKRLSSILPDRRKSFGRRQSDLQPGNA
ncbi:MAG: hypothetical protein R3E62_07790 [Pseudomonadales bacterium]